MFLPARNGLRSFLKPLLKLGTALDELCKISLTLSVRKRFLGTSILRSSILIVLMAFQRIMGRMCTPMLVA